LEDFLVKFSNIVPFALLYQLTPRTNSTFNAINAINAVKSGIIFYILYERMYVLITTLTYL